MPCVLGLLVLAVILGRTTCSRAAEQKHGRPIEFSDPKGADVNTNLNVLDLKRGGLRDMEEDLSKFFPRSFSPGSSLDGLGATPLPASPVPVMPNKRAKEARERRLNWVWQNPAELTSGPTAEELFKLPEYGPDGKEKKKSPSVENFYQRLEREHRSDGEKTEDDDPTQPPKRTVSFDDLKPDPDGTMPAQMSDGERAIRRLFDSQPAVHEQTTESSHTSVSDIFGLGNSASSPELLESQKIIRNQFDSLLSPLSTPSSVTELQNSLGGISDSRSVVIPQFDPPARSTFEPTLGTLATPFTGSALPELNTKDLSSSWSTPSAPGRIELPKVPTAPSVFDFPRRKF